MSAGLTNAHPVTGNLMSDEEDLIDDVEGEEDDVEEATPFVSSIDSRRRVEAKLEELRLKKLTDDYDFD